MKTKQTAINQDRFKPSIWTTEENGAKLALLVCERCFFKSPHTITDKEKIVTDSFTHPIAIIINSPAIILADFKDKSHTWHTHPPEAFGISRNAAAAALAEAYRLAEKIQPACFPPTQWSMHFKVDRLERLVDCDTPTEESIFRAVSLSIHWDLVKKEVKPLQKRWEAAAALLQAMGIPSDWRQVKKITEKHGL